MLDKETCNHASLVTDWSSSFPKSLEESMFERRWFYLKVSATDAMVKIENNLKSLLDGVSSVVTWLPKTSTSCCRPGARERCRTSKNIRLNENWVVSHHLDKREFWGLSQKYLEPSILFKDWTITDSESWNWFLHPDEFKQLCFPLSSMQCEDIWN